MGKFTTIVYFADCFYKIWKFILLETCSFFYKTMASLSSTVGNPTKLLASSHGSCEWNSHSGNFEWDDPMFIHMKFNYTYQPWSCSCYNDYTELILKTLGHIIVDSSSGKICISANLLLPESKRSCWYIFMFPNISTVIQSMYLLNDSWIHDAFEQPISYMVAFLFFSPSL